jgi:putative endonuclease
MWRGSQIQCCSRGRRRRLGRAGEDAALRAEGYRILEWNERLRRGEPDVIVEEAAAIAFVGVKARRSKIYGTPAESAGVRKQHSFVQLAVGYLARRGLGDRVCRFDVVEVGRRVGGPAGGDSRDAFRP